MIYFLTRLTRTPINSKMIRFPLIPFFSNLQSADSNSSRREPFFVSFGSSSQRVSAVILLLFLLQIKVEFRSNYIRDQYLTLKSHRHYHIVKLSLRALLEVSTPLTTYLSPFIVIIIIFIIVINNLTCWIILLANLQDYSCDAFTSIFRYLINN